MNQNTHTTDNSDNQIILTEVKLRTGLKPGKRVLNRMSTILNVETLGDYTDDTLSAVCHLCKDIDFQQKDATRSQKVMAYRKANKLLETVAAFSSFAGPQAINEICAKVAYLIPTNTDIVEFRMLVNKHILDSR